MAANQVGHPCPAAAPGNVEQSCPAGWVLLRALLSRSTPHQNQLPCLSHVSETWGWSGSSAKDSASSSLGSASAHPASKGLGLVTASWHVLLMPWSPGEAAALHTHLFLTTSCSVLTSSMAAP